MKQFMDIEVYLSGNEGTDHLKLRSDGNAKHPDSVQILVSENGADTNLGWFNIDQLRGILNAFKVSNMHFVGESNEQR